MIESHFTDALSFIKEYDKLADCNLVDFLTKNLWRTCLPEPLRLELEDIESTKLMEIHENYNFNSLTIASSKLNDFVQSTMSLSLKNSQSVTKLDTLLPIVPDLKSLEGNSMNFMSNKKQHEIKILSQLVAYLVKKCDLRLVIDAGTGKGYLSTSISQNEEISVLGIDSSESNIKAAVNRKKMFLKKNNKTDLDLVRYSVDYIDENTDYKKIIEAEFADSSMSESCILTGLHTCGQLAHSMIRSFLNSDCIKCLCVVPCCYHLTKESLSGHCNFTKNARMIAQQSVERNESEKKINSHSPSLFYRAMLQIILQSLGIPDTRIGRGAPTQDFPTYVYWALKKIGVDEEKMPSVEDLNQLYETHSNSQWRFNVFQSMRIHLGSVLEAAIVLDRVTYLQTSSQCSKVTLIQLFNPVISPRCYAIVASK